MPKRVRVNARRYAALERPCFQPELHRALTEPSSGFAHEQRVVIERRQLRPQSQPRVQRGNCLRAYRHDPRLGAFAGDPDGALIVIHVGRPEARELAQAQTGRIQELEHRFIAYLEERAGFYFEQRMSLVGRERDGKALHRLRRTESLTRVLSETVIAREITKESAPRRKKPRERPRTQ